MRSASERGASPSSSSQRLHDGSSTQDRITASLAEAAGMVQSCFKAVAAHPLRAEEGGRNGGGEGVQVRSGGEDAENRGGGERTLVAKTKYAQF